MEWLGYLILGLFLAALGAFNFWQGVRYQRYYLSKGRWF